MFIQKGILSLVLSLSFLSCEPAQFNFKPIEKNNNSASPKKTWFGKIQTEVFADKCMKCHSSETEKNHHVDLTSFKTIMESNAFLKVVKPGSPEKSSLYTSIMKQPGEVGAMPKMADRLSDKEIEMIKQWILAGAPEKSKPGEPGEGEPGEGEPGEGEPGEGEPGEGEPPG